VSTPVAFDELGLRGARSISVDSSARGKSGRLNFD
jgi:hypothetical protein